MQTVDASFLLCRRTPFFKFELTAVHHGSSGGEALGAHILAAMLNTRVEVWNKAMDTSLVWHRSRHPLRYFQSVAFHKVTTLA